MSKTIRLLMPQWQGGNNPAYSFGAQLLAWLAPTTPNISQFEVPVEPYNGEELVLEDGVIARSTLLRQLEAAKKIINKQQPDRIIMFGGDCLVSQAPFSYLNKKYQDTFGVLWLDAHPDVSDPSMHQHEHAMVLGNLLGEGDAVFSSKVKHPLAPRQIMYGGLQEMTMKETEIVQRLNIQSVASKDLATTSTPIIKWIQENNIQHLAIHFDLDVLDPNLFRSLLFSNPEGPTINAPTGYMTLRQISNIIKDVSKETDVVGLSITEHLPWDAMNLRDFLSELPIFKESK